MAINENDIQCYLGTDDRPFDFTTDSGKVGRSWIDGTLVVYDPDDCPEWLANALKHSERDEDGNTGATMVSNVWDDARMDEPSLL